MEASRFCGLLGTLSLALSCQHSTQNHIPLHPQQQLATSCASRPRTTLQCCRHPRAPATILHLGALRPGVNVHSARKEPAGTLSSNLGAQQPRKNKESLGCWQHTACRDACHAAPCLLRLGAAGISWKMRFPAQPQQNTALPRASPGTAGAAPTHTAAVHAAALRGHGSPGPAAQSSAVPALLTPRPCFVLPQQ